MFTLILLMAVLIAADQLTKWIAVVSLRGQDGVAILGHFLGFTYHENKGAAWGILSNHRWVFMVISAVAIVVLFIYLCRTHARLHPLFRIALAMIVAGGIGNMIDRTLLGYVVDFIAIDLPYYSFSAGALKFYNFPVFNFADMCITVAAVLMLIWAIFIDFPASFRAEKAAKAKLNASDSEDKE